MTAKRADREDWAARLRRAWWGLAGWLLGALALVWRLSLRVQVSLDPALESAGDRPWVLAFFHGTQFPLLAWRRRRTTVVLVSLSADGTMQARALRVQGLVVARGSTSRGGARGLAALVHKMRRDRTDAAFAVDGPRGPYGSVHGGAAAAARAVGGVLVPMGGAARAAIVFARAWDRFVLPWPFTRAHVVIGAPIDPADYPDRDADLSRDLASAVAAANARASAQSSAGHAPARLA